jgi:XTP/dITP diphosphohydrolase
MRLVAATGNKKKLEEIKAALKGTGVEVILARDAGYECDLPVETEDSFEGNAAIKAEAVAEALGVSALADDSGLVVLSLNGAPGVTSARYAGVEHDDAANNRKLLEEMKDVPEGKREAKFVCVMALARPRKKTRFFTGEVKGRILFEPRGTSGFGYDPLFYSPELKKTFAEVPAGKAQISHRVRALEKVVAFLKKEASHGGR